MPLLHFVKKSISKQRKTGPQWKIWRKKNEIIREKTLSDNFKSRQTKKNTLHKIWAKTSKQILLQLFEKLRREGCHQRNNAFEQYAEWKQHLYISCKISDISNFEDKIYLS